MSEHDGLRIRTRVTAAAALGTPRPVGTSGLVVPRTREWQCACCDRQRLLIKGDPFPLCACHPGETTWIGI